jgi:hypothetical protein
VTTSCVRVHVLHVCLLVLLTLIRPDQTVREQARRRQGGLAARCGSCLQRAISVGNDALYDRRRRLDAGHAKQAGSFAPGRAPAYPELISNAHETEEVTPAHRHLINQRPARPTQPRTVA